MSESFDDQLSRVRLMSEGDPTWDLSPNDIAALKAVLSVLNDSVMFMRRMSYMLKDHPSRIQRRAEDWMRRNGLQGSILRGATDETRCHACHGLGTPPGEAAGLVCGNCMGSGLEPDETVD